MEANLLTAFLMPLALAMIMFGMGLTLSFGEFRSVIQQPTAFAIGFVNQMILVPLLAFAISLGLHLSPDLAVGMMLIAACPGGASTNLITFLSRGNVALSISLTTIDGFLAVITIPLILNFSISYFYGGSSDISVPLMETIGKIILMIILPVTIGVLVKKKFPKRSAQLARWSKPVSGILFFLILLSIFIGAFDMIMASAYDLGISSLLLNIGGMAAGFILASIFGLNTRDKIAIMIESSIQNGGLAIVIASSILMKPELSLVAGIYSVFMFAATGIIIGVSMSLVK